MNKPIVINFLKRAVVIPVLVTAITIGCVYAYVHFSSGHQKASSANSNPVYQVEQYDKFSQFKEGDYIGKLRCESLDLAVDVTAFGSVSNSIVMSDVSKEPWEDGSVILIGTSAKNQLASFRRINKGDKLSFEAYANDKFEYVITDIEYGYRDEDIARLKGKNKLYVCRSYNDFSNRGEAKLYAVYSAEKEGGI